MEPVAFYPDLCRPAQAENYACKMAKGIGTALAARFCTRFDQQQAIRQSPCMHTMRCCVRDMPESIGRMLTGDASASSRQRRPISRRRHAPGGGSGPTRVSQAVAGTLARWASRASKQQATTAVEIRCAASVHEPLPRDGRAPACAGGGCRQPCFRQAPTAVAWTRDGVRPRAGGVAAQSCVAGRVVPARSRVGSVGGGGRMYEYRVAGQCSAVQARTWAS